MNYPVIINNLLAQSFYHGKLRVKPTADKRFALQARVGSAWVSIQTLDDNPEIPANDPKGNPPLRLA